MIIKPSNSDQWLMSFTKKTNCLGEHEFDSCVKYFLARLSSPNGRTSDYQSPRELTPNNIK